MNVKLLLKDDYIYSYIKIGKTHKNNQHEIDINEDQLPENFFEFFEPYLYKYKNGKFEIIDRDNFEETKEEYESETDRLKRESAETQFLLFENQKEIEKLKKENSETIQEIIRLKGDKK